MMWADSDLPDVFPSFLYPILQTIPDYSRLLRVFLLVQATFNDAQYRQGGVF